MEIPKRLNDLSYRIVGICMAVHRELGPRFPEQYYQRALEYELTNARIKYEAQKPIQVHYKAVSVGLCYLDLLIEDELVLEIKSTSHLDDVRLAQTLKYLAAANLDVGLLVNFGESSLTFKSVVLPIKLQQARANHKQNQPN